MNTAINHGRELAEALDKDGYQYRPEQLEREEVRREYAPRTNPDRNQNDAEPSGLMNALLFYPVPALVLWLGLAVCYCIAASCGVVW